MKRRILGQIVLIIAVIIIVASGIFIWLNLVDVRIIGGFFVIALILIGAGVFLSKKK